MAGSVRSGIAQEIASGDPTILSEHTSPSFNREDSPGLGLHMLRTRFFPDLTVAVFDTAELHDGRVLVRMNVATSSAANAASWPAVIIVGFEGDQVESVWSLHDPTTWMEAAGLTLADL